MYLLKQFSYFSRDVKNISLRLSRFSKRKKRKEKKKEFQVSLVAGSRVSLPPSSFNVVTNRGENWPGFRGHVITAYDSR